MQNIKAVLKDRNFLIYWVGTAVSLVGDTVSFIALPWLVLRLTGEPVMLGLVMGIQALPRAVLMLFGGVAADHFSPRRVLMVARGVSIFVLFALGLLVVTGTIQVWMVYPFALVLGTIGAFQIPAAMSIVPTLVPPDELRAANAAVNSTSQLAMILGPSLAGFMIGLFGDTEVTGVGYAFLIDSATFVFSTASLMFVVARGPDGGPPPAMGVWARVKKGLSYAGRDVGIRSLLIYIAAINFFGIGVLLVGLPVFADTQLTLGAQGYGYLMSAMGAGSLLGSLLAGALPSPPEGKTGLILFPLSAINGLLIAALPFFAWVVGAVGVMAVMGTIMGYANVFLLTWLQGRVETAMIGRVMSIVTLANFGLVPVSTAISGFLIEGVGLSALMILAGVMLSVAALACLSVPSLRALSAKKSDAPGESPAPEVQGNP